MPQINTGQIQSLDVSWENYAGSSVEDFIKRELRQSCGYIYRSRTKEGDFYYLYGFQCIEDFYKWADGDNTVIPLFKVQLPNIENDSFSANLTTTSNTNKLVNLGSGVKINIRFTSTATNPTTQVTTDTYNDGTLIIQRSSNGSIFTEVGRINIPSVEYESSNSQIIDITEYLTDGNNKIRIRVEDNVNGSVSNNITFNSIINTTLRVENATNIAVPLSQPVFQYYIEGQVAKTLNIKITDSSLAVKSYEFAVGEATYLEIPYTASIDDNFNSGIIKVEAWLSVDDTTLESEHINNQFYFIGSGSTESVIILNNVANTVTNYANTRFFDFTLYNSNSDVYIKVAAGANTLLEYTYRNCQVGQVYSFYNTLELESNVDYLNAVVSVQTSSMTEQHDIVIDNTEKMTPTEGADFVLNPKTRSNTEAAPESIINAISGVLVPSEFEGFNFQSDGWVNDSNGIGVLRIPAGQSLTISYDPLDTLSNGTTIELDYKVYNVFNSDDVMLKFCSYASDENPLGFEMKASEAVFMTTEKRMKRDQDIMFREGARTHVAINIVPNLSGSGLNYIRIFVNGVMNREILYTNTDIFKSGVLNMVFGSENNDLDIYGIRVYKKGLSASNVRQDYMSSLPTAADKIAFKTANDILSSNGTISYDKAVNKYNTLVWVGQHPEYSTGKVTFKGDLQVNIIGDLAHSGKLTNMQISGQGSSSRGYWKWNHQYDFDKYAEKSVWTNGLGESVDGYYILDDNDPKCKKLVSKLNWASPQQSHKMGSTALYNDLWKSIIGGNSITRTDGYDKVRVAVHEKPFLYFFKENDQAQPVFGGLITFGSAKGDAPTFGYDSARFPDYLCVEGSDNGMPLTLRQVPWFDDEVTYNAGEKYWQYDGEGQLDLCLGNKDKIGYFKDAYNYTYLHSTRLKSYTEDSELTDTTYQYWNTETGDVVRYDHITEAWVDAGATKDQNGQYTKLNIRTQTGLSSGTNDDFINWRIADFKTGVSNYYNVNDTLFTMAFLKLIAASDNRCKNTYEYLDPVTHKICHIQDDLDTIMLTDNVGRKTKPYYVEEHDMNGTQTFWNGEDNVFYNLMEAAFNNELRLMMKSILDTMGSTEFGGSIANCLNRYYFSTQKYFPAVAYNETARLLYEEASVKQSEGVYTNGTPAISQSLGDQLQAELGWWDKRLPYMQSWASSDPFYVRSNKSLGFRSMLTVDSTRPTYQFVLTPCQWLYPKIGVGQSMGQDNTRVAVGEDYTTSTISTDGNTDVFIYGANYYTNYGEFGGMSIGEAFELSGDRLLEFSADARKFD